MNNSFSEFVNTVLKPAAERVSREPSCLTCKWYDKNERKKSPCNQCCHGSEAKGDYHLPNAEWYKDNV